MTLLRPFSGYIPSRAHACRVVGPPSSMLNAEQREALRDDELSFRNQVGRGAKAPQEQAMRWLQHSIGVGALQPVNSSVIVHRLVNGDFTATGLLADVSIAGYDAGRVKRHEATITKSQQKMANYMRATRLLGNPVALAHRTNTALESALQQQTRVDPDVEFEAIDGAVHSLWIMGGSQAERICNLLDDVLYITDGHHRLAAASLLAAEEGIGATYFPAAVYAEDQLRLGAFARSITDDSLAPADVLAWLQARFPMHEVQGSVPRPSLPHQIGVRVDGRSFLLDIPAEQIPPDLYEQLDVSLLGDLILRPLAGVEDSRTDRRMRFTADTVATDHDVDGSSAWFLPYPTQVPDVMAVADRGQTMPPKSTFFMPKVPSGLVVRMLDSD